MQQAITVIGVCSESDISLLCCTLSCVALLWLHWGYDLD